MALWRSKGARKDATRGTAPIEVRKSDALLFTNTGVIPGSTQPLVTGTAGFTYNVGKAGFVTSLGESDGVHFFGNDGVAATPAVAVAPGAGLSRIDIIWVRHPAAGENADTTSEPEFGVSSGVAAASPNAPSIPAGALELARNTMTSAATSTASAGNAITQTAAVVKMRVGKRIRRIALPGSSGSISTTELVWMSTQGVVSATGSIRLTIRGNAQATDAGAQYLIRVRQGAADGPELLGFYAYIGVANRTSFCHVDTATIPAGVGTALYVTAQRSSGTGTVQFLTGTSLIVDEDPA